MGEFTLLFPSVSAELIANIYECACHIMQFKKPHGTSQNGRQILELNTSE